MLGRSILLMACLTAALAGPVSAGPLRDRLLERRAERESATSDEMGADERSRDPTAFIQGIPGARVLADLAYGSRSKERMDVYLPANPSGAPVLMMVHGGAWEIGDKSSAKVVANKAAHYLPKGFILVSVNYPLVPEVGVLDQAGAIRAALAFVRQNALSWGGDPGRILLAGHSAGAHLVSLVSSDPQGAGTWRATIALDSAAYDLVPIMQARRHFRFYDAVFGDDPVLWRAASPLHRLRQDVPLPPMMLVCSTRRTESCMQARRFAAAGKEHGATLQVLEQDMSHGEINGEMGAPGPYTQAVDAFIEQVLK